MAAQDSVDQEAPLINDGISSSDEHEHYIHRAPWLRAFILGANDGLVGGYEATIHCRVASKVPSLRTQRTCSD